MQTPTNLNRLTGHLPQIVLGEDNILAFTQKFDFNYSSYLKWTKEAVGITSRSNDKIIEACGVDLIASIRQANTLVIFDQKWFEKTFPGATKRARDLGYEIRIGHDQQQHLISDVSTETVKQYSNPSARMKTNIPIPPIKREKLKAGQLCSIIRQNDEYICGYAHLRSKDILLKSRDGAYQCKIPFSDIKTIYPQEEV